MACDNRNVVELTVWGSFTLAVVSSGTTSNIENIPSLILQLQITRPYLLSNLVFNQVIWPPGIGSTLNFFHCAAYQY